MNLPIRLVAWRDRFAAESKAAEATGVYRQALESAREIKQIQQIKEGLDKLGVKVDLPRHFGFLMQWHLIGPFDNTGRKGFDAVFPPERGIDLAAEHPGKSGPVRWVPFVTEHEHGLVNINLPFGPLKAGKNTILVKVCQNEQTEAWTKEWEFQLRVCDARGTAVLSADRPPSSVKQDPPK